MIVKLTVGFKHVAFSVNILDDSKINEQAVLSPLNEYNSNTLNALYKKIRWSAITEFYVDL